MSEKEDELSPPGPQDKMRSRSKKSGEKDRKEPPTKSGKSPSTSSKQKRKRFPDPMALFPSTGGLGGEAEGYLLRVLEERKARAKSHDADWDPSVEGERPPLRRVSFQGAHMFETLENNQHENVEDVHTSAARQRFRNLAVKVRTMQSQRRLSVQPSDEPEIITPKSPEHAQQKAGVFEGVGGEDKPIGESAFSQADTNTDKVIIAAMLVNENYHKDDETASVLSSSGYSDAPTEGTDEELLPLTGNEPSQRRGWFGDSAELRRRRKAARKKWRKRRRRCMRKLNKTCRCERYWFSDLFNPVFIGKSIVRFITTSWFTKLGFPSLMAAIVLFYFLRNPSLDCVGEATLSWWLLFIARQTLMLQLAFISERIVIDGFALKSRLAVGIFSPLLTLCIISSKGWPFLFVAWALWDMTLLHGDDEFQQNWFFWTGVRLFSPENRGGNILERDLYLRLLLAMLIAGVAAACKRTALALYFGKKTVLNYRSRMDKILADMAILSEVGQLASEAGNLVEAAAENQEPINAAGLVSSLQWTNIEALDTSSEEGSARGGEHQATARDEMKEDPETVEADHARRLASTSDVGNESLTSNDEFEDIKDSVSDSEEDDSSGGFDADDLAAVRADEKFQYYSSRESLSSSDKRFKNLLDRWEEPENMSVKTTDASIADILLFRKLLSHMDTPFPFSSYFGRASTRDECIKSSQKTYFRLLKLDPGGTMLSFDVIGLLAIDTDGNEDESKRRVLKRLFRPGRFNEITLLAFVQGCDSVYKRLRYFRASVGNSSIIDQVLEQIVDCIFYFVLLLLILSVLKLNPWALLVSISTLLFSTAFAIGPSLSRYIEGILLIIARRPYDLGDRILIIGSENPENFNVAHSFFVQDINLFSTTLRFANTNEVATVNNASITMSRIINYNRSPNAMVTLTLFFMDTATEDQLGTFRETVDSFVQDRPRVWDSIMFFRCECINQDLGLMEYSLRVRHTKPWQDAPSILMNKAELLKFCFETGKRLGINYDSPPRASWTINSFAGDEVPADMNAALNAFGNAEPEGDTDTQHPFRQWFQGRGKGMRSLENRRTRTGGQFTFNR